MTNSIDLIPESDLHVVGEFAVELGIRIREEDPRSMFDHLLSFCHHHPAKAAQLLMTFAAWFDTEETIDTLAQRAEAITASRIRAMA